MKVECWKCGSNFEGYYNSRYCSKLCKGRAKRNREGYSPAARRNSYETTKTDPVRYAAHLSSGREGRAIARNWLADYKLAEGCIDCGYGDHHAALQLDHEGIKSISIADARSSITRLKKEIREGQCVVRCGNCHVIRTWERKQHGVKTPELLSWQNGSSLDRGRLDAALVDLLWAVRDIRETVAEVRLATIVASPQPSNDPALGRANSVRPESPALHAALVANTT